LRRYARVLKRNSRYADDLVQDTMVRAWEKQALWRRGPDLRTWLFTIMHNLYINHLPLARREATHLPIMSDGEQGAVVEEMVHGDQIEHVELREVMRRVQGLPAEQREVLLLAAIEGLRYDEIAATLAIPIGTVMSPLSRPRNKLRRMMNTPPGLRGEVSEHK
jgi:RNA polymerase sigma-70 factor (ECF subfamily)